MSRNRLLLTTAALGALMIAAPAAAQKSKDTLRIAYTDPISIVDLIHDPKPETALTARIVFDGLVHFDDFNKEFKPLLAKSWKRVDELTLEFELRDDIKFHDGSAFDADDAVYTINWLIDPKTKVRFKTNYIWIGSVEKLGRYKIRIKTRRPAPEGLMRLAKSIPMFPSDVHGALANKATFGKKPVGTGPWRVTSISPTGGIKMSSRKIAHGGDYKNATNIKNVHAVPIPNRQTQVAQLLTGGVDLVRGLRRDQVNNLAADPRFGVTSTTGMLYSYILFDAANRSGKSELSDVNVRKAILQGIDREAIQKNIVAGGADDPVPPALCQDYQLGCDFSPVPYKFDAAKAKAALAAAGYPNGFEATISALGPAGVVAEAVAGQLRKLGIKAGVNRLNFGAYRKQQRDGKFQILVSMWSSGGLPDTSSTANMMFAPGPRNYNGDKLLNALRLKGNSELDEAKRKAAYKAMFDRVNQQAYVMPLTTMPTVYVHSKDVEVLKGSLSPYGASLSHIRWK